MTRFALDGIVSFSLVPLRLATLCGLVTVAMTVLAVLYALASRPFTGHWASGWTWLMMAVFFLGGMCLLCLGIVGEYVGRIYRELQRRPLYVVDETIGFRHEVPPASM